MLSDKIENPEALLHIAEVVSNTDTGNRGRVQVWLPQFYDNKDDATLFWAYPISATFGGSTGNEKNGQQSDAWGTYSVPQVGELLVVGALAGDMSALVYFGSFHSGYQLFPNADQTSWMLRMPNGHEFVFRYGTNNVDVRLKTKLGLEMLLDDTNKKIVLTSGDQTFTMDDGNKKMVFDSGTNAVTFDETNKKLELATAGGLSAALDDAANKITLTAGGATAVLDKGADQITLSAGGATVTIGPSGIINLN